jgi:hypothetical protein
VKFSRARETYFHESRQSLWARCSVLFARLFSSWEQELHLEA